MKNKLKTLDDLSAIIARVKADGRKVIFSNGCFDILHVGHVRYLQAARALGDCLVIAVNSDSSIRGLKGEKRPIVPQGERAELLAALECVDYVTIFEEPDPLNVIKSIKPSSLVKGGDWSEDQIIGGDFVKSTGGRVELIPYIEGASTTNIIEEIIERYCRA
ncbi:MAG: D-glycero-beta-D-manno-heptose 1-phosphate adenylyltransferase [Proteobacteria bacterium]|nr:D-glycero-beta-D-manno-heptose 1-phosphate adenylyltransferase [Pseudomonadota bacterium]